MKILLFGATGGTGRQVAAQALAAGHLVTAFLRQPAKLKCMHPSLRLVQGDVLDYPAVLQAMQGQEAVLSTLGAPASQKDNLRSAGTRHIVQAMQAAGVRRFVCMTTLGIGDSREALPWHYKYVLVPLLLQHAFADSEVQEGVIRASRTDWTVVRPGELTNGPRTSSYQHGFAARTQGLRIKVSRADVADFMLRQLTDLTYLHQTPGLSY
jgi:putative NADH-flavin reductase